MITSAFARVFLSINLFLFVSNVSADFVDGHALVRMIEAGKRLDAAVEMEGDVELSAQLTGYMQGLLDSLVHTKVLCLPPRANIDQIQKMVIRYAKANPKSHAGPGSFIVFLALPTSYRCHK